MTEPTLLTVAVPTCNGARHLAEALRSIRAQEGVDFDLVVSDDRSDDETLAVVRSVAGDRARLEVNTERLGLAGNWNRCVAPSRTEWVAVFHQDDVMPPGHLPAHVKAILSRESERLGLVAGPARVIDDAGRPVPSSVVDQRGFGIGGIMQAGVESLWFPPGECLEFLSCRNPLFCSAVTTRRAAHADVGGFNSAYRYAVDWDFWLRVARRWGITWLLRPPAVAIRWHPASETHRFRDGTVDLEEQVRLLDALYAEDSPRLPDARRLRRAADRRLARAFLNRAYEAQRRGDPILARSCLRRAVGLRPGIVGTILRDPRLAVRMATLVVAPGLSSRRTRPRDADRP